MQVRVLFPAPLSSGHCAFLISARFGLIVKFLVAPLNTRKRSRPLPFSLKCAVRGGRGASGRGNGNYMRPARRDVKRGIRPSTFTKRFGRTILSHKEM